MADVAAIYDRLFPDRTLRYMLYEGADAIRGRPTVTEGSESFKPGHFSPEFLGCVERPAPQPGAPVTTIYLSIPRAPTPQELKQNDGVWGPPRPLRALFGLAPLVYEHIRYRAEVRRQRKAARRHAMYPLAAGQAAAQFVQAPPTDHPARPAILIGMHWLEVGGAEKLGFDTVKWALAAGLRVFVVVNVRSLQRLAERLPAHPDVTFLRLDRYLPDHLWPRFVEKLVQAENIRAVHIHHCTALYDCLPQLRITAPWVKIIDSTHIVEYADGGYPRISGVWTNYIDVHHVISRNLTEYYRDNFQVLNKVRLGRMLERAEITSAPPPLTLSSGKKALHVAFIGRLFYQKRPIVVAETFRALAAWAKGAGVELTGTLVGEGPFSGAVARLLQRWGLNDRITMLPANVDVPALLRRSDLLILPSNNEGLALVCYEAVEHGCLPISTDVGGQKELLPADLLVPLAPRAAVRETVVILDRLWRDPAALAAAGAALHAGRAAIAADPTAEEVLMPIYRAAAAQE